MIQIVEQALTAPLQIHQALLAGFAQPSRKNITVRFLQPEPLKFGPKGWRLQGPGSFTTDLKNWLGPKTLPISVADCFFAGKGWKLQIEVLSPKPAIGPAVGRRLGNPSPGTKTSVEFSVVEQLLSLNTPRPLSDTATEIT